MKKITLFAAVFFLIFSARAQGVLFEQTGDGDHGFGTGYANFSSIGIYATDDFDLSVQSDIYSITFYGSQPNDNMESLITAYSFYIYEDASGVPAGNPSLPGTGVMEIIELDPSDPAVTLSNVSGINYEITIDIAAAQGAPLTLDPGTYWIVPAPHGDATITQSDNLWYWHISDEANLSGAKFIDPINVFQQGWDSWTPISAFPGASGNAFSFTVMGENLAISDTPPVAQISLYPNPVKDKLYIDVPANLELQSAVLFNLLGEKIPVAIDKDNIADLSNLSSGIYVLQLKTAEETLTKKLIKR